MHLYCELVPLEVRPAFREASEALSGLHDGIAWAGAFGMVSEEQIALVQAEVVRARGTVAELLRAYCRGELTIADVTRQLREVMDATSVLVRAGVADEVREKR